MKTKISVKEACGFVALFTLVVMVWLGGFSPRKSNGEALPEADTMAVDSVAATDEPVLTREDSISAMFSAFSLQESGDNDSAVSPCGRYVGCVQLSKIMVREANRIIGEDLYCYEDRLDRGCSFGMFMAVQLHHNPTLDIDRAIDIWNRYAPKAYRDNVKMYYQERIGNIEEY